MIPPIYANILEPSDIEPSLLNLAKSMLSNDLDFYLDEEGVFKSDRKGVRTNNPLINKHNDILLSMAQDETMPSLSAYVSEQYSKSIFPKFLRAWEALNAATNLVSNCIRIDIVEGGLRGPNFFISTTTPRDTLNIISLGNSDMPIKNVEYYAPDGDFYRQEGISLVSYVGGLNKEGLVLAPFFGCQKKLNLRIILPYDIQCKIITNLLKLY